MARYAKYCFMKRLYAVFALVLLTLTTSLAARASGGQDDRKPSQVTEGCLLYRSPISDRFDPVPLIHTDVVLDVRGLVASATVTQQYANSSTEPIEAVYIFPLAHDAAPQSGSRSPEKTGGCRWPLTSRTSSRPSGIPAALPPNCFPTRSEAPVQTNLPQRLPKPVPCCKLPG
jgi:Vault protein inter-alpha-trypsin domain